MRVRGDGRAAGAVQRGEERALALDADARLLVVQLGEEAQLLLVAGAARDADGTLRHRGEHHVHVQHLCGVLRHLHAVQARDRQQRAVHDALLELADARLHVAAEVHALQLGELAQELRLAAERRGADERAVGELGQVVVLDGDERVAHVLAGEHAGQDGALGQVRGHVLHGVHRDVDATVEQRDVQLAREQPFPADVRQGLVQNLVAGGLRDARMRIRRKRRVACAVSERSRREAAGVRSVASRRRVLFQPPRKRGDLAGISVRERRSIRRRSRLETYLDDADLESAVLSELGEVLLEAVSYTHLTLPTILLV